MLNQADITLYLGKIYPPECFKEGRFENLDLSDKVQKNEWLRALSRLNYHVNSEHLKKYVLNPFLAKSEEEAKIKFGAFHEIYPTSFLRSKPITYSHGMLSYKRILSIPLDQFTLSQIKESVRNILLDEDELEALEFRGKTEEFLESIIET